MPGKAAPDVQSIREAGNIDEEFVAGRNAPILSAINVSAGRPCWQHGWRDTLPGGSGDFLASLPDLLRAESAHQGAPRAPRDSATGRIRSSTANEEEIERAVGGAGMGGSRVPFPRVEGPRVRQITALRCNQA